MMRYKMLGQSGVKVSELCLGTMSFGSKWGFGADEKTSLQIAQLYAEAGGNFLDTANKYHEGESSSSDTHNRGNLCENHQTEPRPLGRGHQVHLVDEER